MIFKQGSVIFFNPDGSNVLDPITQLATKRTHVGMFVSPDTFVESVAFKGVRYTKFDPNWKNVTIYKPTDDISDERIEKATLLAQEFIGEGYDYISAILAWICEKFGLISMQEKFDKNWDCSEYTAMLLRYGMQVPAKFKNLPLRFVLPDHIESDLRSMGWQTYQF